MKISCVRERKQTCWRKGSWEFLLVQFYGHKITKEVTHFHLFKYTLETRVNFCCFDWSLRIECRRTLAQRQMIQTCGAITDTWNSFCICVSTKSRSVSFEPHWLNFKMNHSNEHTHSKQIYDKLLPKNERQKKNKAKISLPKNVRTLTENKSRKYIIRTCFICDRISFVIKIRSNIACLNRFGFGLRKSCVFEEENSLHFHRFFHNLYCLRSGR